MHSVEAQVRARNFAFDRINVLTAWIAMGALALLGVFAVIAGATIPGKADTGQASSTNTDSTGASAPSTSSGTSVFHHHRDNSNGTTISSSSGPPMVVTGGSR